MRSDFIELTGRTELIPLYALGGWDSRYYPYTQTEALAKIDTYRSKNIPLDIFVVDTDWRVGASHGYGVNTELFPDMEQFISEAHNRHTRIVFNDHPEPQANALDPAEVEYRNTGLRSLFDIGLDFWWYDRNWHTAIRPPDGINKEVFGMYLYHWVTQDYYPDRRPLIMANVDGIDNGYLNGPPNLASHRYTMQWTGDTTQDWDSLAREIRNAVYPGVFAAFPYVSTDLGGHMGSLTVEQYCRWAQFGAFSPIFRLHCSRGQTRDPWAYDDPAEQVVRDFVQMRMRLLPVYYTAARQNYDTGEPILKRCDLNYPDYPAAASDYQYLLGNDILVAPVYSGDSDNQAVPAAWLTHNGSSGLSARYYAGMEFNGNPVLVRTDSTVNFDWGSGNPGNNLPNDLFSASWTGTITIGAEEEIKLGITVDDGARVWLNNSIVIDAWQDQAETTYWTDAVYTPGQILPIRIEYYEKTGQAVCKLIYQKASVEGTRKSLWIPPGPWVDVWSGQEIVGPTDYTCSVPLTQMPLFVKAGSIIPLAPDMQYTAQQTWDPIVLDVYPAQNGAASASLYEDDTVSNDYKQGLCRQTGFGLTTNSDQQKITLQIHPAQGDSWPQAPRNRAWSIRLHLSNAWPDTPQTVLVDGKPAAFTQITANPSAQPFSITGPSPDQDIILVIIPSGSVQSPHIITFNYNALSSADFDYDGDVDKQDLSLFCPAWLAIPGHPNYNSIFDLFSDSSNQINLCDFALLSHEYFPD